MLLKFDKFYMRFMKNMFMSINENNAETHVLDSGMSDVNIEAFSLNWSEFANYVISIETFLP